MKKIIYLFVVIILYIQTVTVFASEPQYGDLTVSIDGAVIQYDEFNVDFLVDNSSNSAYTFQPFIACYNDVGNYIGLYGLSNYTVDANSSTRIEEMIYSNQSCNCISQIKIMLFKEYYDGVVLCEPVECQVENYGHLTENCEWHKEISVTKTFSEHYDEGFECYPKERKVICSIPVWNEGLNHCKILINQQHPNYENVYCDQFTINQNTSSIRLEIDMKNFSSGEYEILYGSTDEYGMIDRFNYYSYDDLDYFFDLVANGRIYDYQSFFSLVKDFGLFSREIEDIYNKYSDEVYQEKTFARINWTKFTYSDEFKQALFEAYVLSVIECSTSTDVIYDLLSAYESELGLDLTEFNSLSTEDKYDVIDRIKNASILYVADLRILIETVIDDIRNSHSGGAVSGGGRLCLSYDFINRLEYEIVEIADSEKEITENVICITGIKNVQNFVPSSIVIPKKINDMRVTSIGEGAFSSLSEVTIVAIPETVDYVAKNAFSGITELTSLYLYSDNSAILDAFEHCIGENTRIVCFENSDTYTQASKLGCIVEAIYEFQIAVTEHNEIVDDIEVCYKDIIFTDNNESYGNIHIKVTDGEGNLLFLARLLEGEILSFENSEDIYVDAYVEWTGKVYYNITSEEHFARHDDIFEFIYEPSEIIYDGIKRQFKITPNDEQDNDCSPSDLNTAVITLYDYSTQKYIVFEEFKDIIGKGEILYNLPQIDKSGEYRFSCNGFVQSVTITSNAEIKTILNEINTGLIETESAYNKLYSLGVFTDADLSYYFSKLNDYGKSKLLADSQDNALQLESYADFLKEKLFLLCVSATSSDLELSFVEQLLLENIDANYSSLSSEEQAELFENVYGVSFEKIKDLKAYIENFILTKQEFTVTFIDFYGNETKVIVNGLACAIVPDIELELTDENGRKYIFARWDKDFSSVVSDMTVNAVYLSNDCELSEVENGVVYQDTVILNSVSHNTEYVYIIPSISEFATWELYSDEELLNKINQITLDDGMNYAWLKIIAESGTYKIYRVEITRKQQLETVESTMLSGYYISGNSSIELLHKNENAKIYYTTDGTVPDENSLLYEEPIFLNEDVVISAIAVCDGYDNSAVQIFKYKIAQEISGIKIMQLYANTAVIGFSQILGAQNTSAYIEYFDSESSTGDETIIFNDNNDMIAVANLRENVYARVVIIAHYPNGDLQKCSEWFLTQVQISTECDIIGVSDPNAIIDNDLLIVKNFKVANQNTQFTIDLTVSDGANYAVFPSRNSKTAYENNTVILNEGNNVFYIRVTASDNISTKTYKIYIYRNTKSSQPEIVVENGIARIISAEGAKIYYSTDKSVPSIMTSIEYSGEFEVCEGMTIRAIAVEADKDEFSEETIFTVNTVKNKFLIDVVDIQDYVNYLELNLNIVGEVDYIPKAAKLIVAQYKKDKSYLGVGIYDINLEKTDVPFKENVDKLDDEAIFKIMLWENGNSQKPLAASITHNCGI